MNISEDVNMSEVGWGGTKAVKYVLWKLHKKAYFTCPQECVGDYVNTEKGTTVSDASASGNFHMCITKREKIGTGNSILDRPSLEKPRTKKIYADILRQPE